MNKTDKILITGASGMVGSAIIRTLVNKGYTNLVGTFRSSIQEEQKDMAVKHIQTDLKDQDALNHLFKTEKPAHVVLAAAKVGGINANNTKKALNAAFFDIYLRVFFEAPSVIERNMDAALKGWTIVNNAENAKPKNVSMRYMSIFYL